MHITLYRKYRSKDFDEIAGQEEIVKGIRNALRTNKIAHALLFSGPRGVGKTSIARLVAKGVNCLTNGMTDTPCNTCENCVSINEGSFMDMIEIDAASNRGIDEIRELKDKINYNPAKGIKKIYIIDEVHMLTKEAFNALLKTLEEPPEHALFILATTEPEKILPTIISRCQRYDFKIISYVKMRERLEFISKMEQIEIEDGVYSLIYDSSLGGMRDAISILERININYYGEKITVDGVEKLLGLTSQIKIDKFIEEIKTENKEKMLEFLEEMWIDSIEIEIFFKDLAKRVRDLLQKKEIQLELGIRVIGAIYNTLLKFKHEEDKRLLGYVIIDELLEINVSNVEYEIVKQGIKPIKSLSQKEEKNTMISKNTTSHREINIKEITDNWELVKKNLKNIKISLIAFLVNAKPKEIRDNELTIEFSKENTFSEQQMSKPVNNEILQQVFSEILGTEIKIKYEIRNVEKSNVKNWKDENITEKIADFFGGTIIEK